ncbi:MAG: hypothetical protein JO170_11495 [Verrucomicrobia bacterium]|nr:hypothetical protein [Verrucomicrobiota bacterium]
MDGRRLPQCSPTNKNGHIINWSYQTKADDIVGKMTIAALDKEMLEAELKPVCLQPILPVARFPIYRPLLAFNITFPGLLDITDLRPVPDRLRAGLKGATVIDEGNFGTTGRAIVLELL